MPDIKNALISIYSASLTDKYWVHALDECSKLMGATASLIYQVSSFGDVDYRLEAASSHFRNLPNILHDYNCMIERGDGSGFDREGMRFVHSRRAFDVRLDSQIFEMGNGYYERPEVKFMAERAGLVRRCAISLADDPSNLTGMIFLYNDSFKDNKLSTLNSVQKLFTPHIAKSLEVHRFTHSLRTKYRAVLSVLDRIGTGVLVVSENANVIVANNVASEVLDAKDGVFTSGKGVLAAKDESVCAALQSGIFNASASAKGEINDAGSVVQIPRERSGISLVAVISPLRDAEVEIERGFAGALVTLIDPLRPVEVHANFVSLAYGLTQAEGRVAGFLLQGLTNSEIGVRIGVSPETIKTQISSIFAKCGCRTRVAFIWRVFQLSPPVK